MRCLQIQWQQHAILFGAGIGFALLAFLPLLSPVAAVFLQQPYKGWQDYEILLSSRPWFLLCRSLGLSCAVVIGAILLGVPMGLLLSRTNIAGRRVLMWIHGFPMFLPPYLLTLGWFYLLGRQGLFGNETTANLLFHSIGYVIVLSLAFAPIVTALVSLGFWNLDPSLEEAARVTARPARVIIHILLPMVWHLIALAAILVFALAFSELGVPMFLRIDVYPAAVFSRLGGVDFNPGEAFFLALPLVPVSVALVAFDRWLFNKHPLDISGLRRPSREPILLGTWRGILSAACWAATLFSILPIAALLLKAGAGGDVLQAGKWVGRSVYNSFIASSLAATLITGFGVILGHGHARRLTGSRVFDMMGVLAMMAPSVLLGLGLITFWNHPQTQYIYGGLGIIVIGYVARYSIIGIRAVSASVAQSPVSIEQAASVFGAGYARRLFCIVLPLHWRALAAVWLLALVFCLRDLETAALCYPPGLEPLTVRIFTLEANGPEPVIAGLAALHAAITAVVLAAGSVFLLGVKRS